MRPLNPPLYEDEWAAEFIQREPERSNPLLGSVLVLGFSAAFWAAVWWLL